MKKPWHTRVTLNSKVGLANYTQLSINCACVRQNRAKVQLFDLVFSGFGALKTKHSHL